MTPTRLYYIAQCSIFFALYSARLCIYTPPSLGILEVMYIHSRHVWIIFFPPSGDVFSDHLFPLTMIPDHLFTLVPLLEVSTLSLMPAEVVYVYARETRNHFRGGKRMCIYILPWTYLCRVVLLWGDKKYLSSHTVLVVP